MQEAENLINEATWQFVRAHAGDDVRTLALRASANPDVDMHKALHQIAGRQMARSKLPSWAARDGIIYPPHLSMEQCSSQTTAEYKARLVMGDTMADLTGGFGVDFAFMAAKCHHATYVERQEHLCQIVGHNLAILGLRQCRVVQAHAEDYLRDMPAVDTLYIDPARRDAQGGRVVALSDCTPDVTQLAPLMLTKARRVIIKLSPMLDVHKAVTSLPSVSQVHIVSVKNECKELLLILDHDHKGAYEVSCVNDDQHFVFDAGTPAPALSYWNENQSEAAYLYEPNASVMKAGCHGLLAARFGLVAVGPNSHLFVSSRPVHNFPGRRFVIAGITTMNKKELRVALQGLSRANVAVRNFPMKAPELARRLRLQDGGDAFIFGTTTASGRHILVLCHRNFAR
ncbi:MAG: SAM-dependent methyltransferase [Muribaculaceae bacterium]|nr:SAM-dependent methyltransferase [Muribaculaceae bacterium]